MSVALNVIIILAIVIAGGFILFFLGDFFLQLVNRDQNGERVESSQPVLLVQEPKKEEKSMVVQAYVPEEVKEEENAPEEDDEEKRIAEARAALERRKEEILKRMQMQIEENDEEEEDEIEEENSEEEAVEEEGTVNTDEEVAEEAEEEGVDTDALQAEIEKLKNELGVEREKYDALERELKERENIVVTSTVAQETLGSKEDYEKMLEEKTNQLKLIEKEFKQCKKDFIPLFRVNKTLEKDEKKLHRKEAIVAKQKVVLYGVNNYADIDEEKAKKLAEDLDLLDGLKLSVNHCREVMENNKDRYPILEKLYNTLKSQVEGLKNEIANIETILATYENDEVSE